MPDSRRKVSIHAGYGGLSGLTATYGARLAPATMRPCCAQCKTPSSFDEGVFNSSLTMSYFHTGTRTIIGAEAFHCPVRDGKEWDHLAMVIRLNRALSRTHVRYSQFAESLNCNRYN